MLSHVCCVESGSAEVGDARDQEASGCGSMHCAQQTVSRDRDACNMHPEVPLLPGSKCSRTNVLIPDIARCLLLCHHIPILSVVAASKAKAVLRLSVMVLY